MEFYLKCVIVMMISFVPLIIDTTVKSENALHLPEWLNNMIKNEAEKSNQVLQDTRNSREEQPRVIRHSRVQQISMWGHL